MTNQNFGASAPPPSSGNRVREFLWQCAAADVERLKRFPEEQAKFTSIGIVMLIIPCFAAVSFSFFLTQIFGMSLLVAVPFSMFYAFVIFNVDRLLLAFHRKGKGEFLRAIPRLLLGVCLAHIIGTTLILQIFRGEIEFEMNRRNQTITAEARRKAEDRFGAERQTLLNQNVEWQNRLDEMKRIRDEKQAAVIGEIEGTVGSGKRGTGPAARQKEQAFEEAKAEYNNAKIEFDQKIANNKKRLDQIQTDIDAEVGLISGAHGKARGLLERHEALMNIVRRDAGAAFFYFPLFFGLLLLELLPLLVKLTSSAGPYDEDGRKGEGDRFIASDEEIREKQAQRQRMVNLRSKRDKLIDDTIFTAQQLSCPNLERLRQLHEQELIAERETEIRKRFAAQNSPAKFDREIEIKIAGRPDLSFHLQLPRESQNDLTLNEMSRDLAILLKKAQSGSPKMEISGITDSTGNELHRALPLLPQLEAGEPLLISLAPSQIQ